MNTRQRTKAEGAEGWSPGRGCAPSLPGQLFLMIFEIEMAHFYAYLRYSDVLILSSAVPPGEGSAKGHVPPPRKILTITNKLIIIMTTRN